MCQAFMKTTSFLYFKGSKSNNIRILELLKLLLPSPQQVLYVYKVPTVNTPCVATELCRDNRLDHAAFFRGLKACCPKESPVQCQNLLLDTRQLWTGGHIILVKQSSKPDANVTTKWVIFRQSTCFCDGGYTIIILMDQAWSNGLTLLENQFGCIKINCYIKQIMETVAVQNKERCKCNGLMSQLMFF